MKSKFEKLEENQENTQEQQDPNDEVYNQSEVDAGGPDVASSKGSKILILLASAILITAVIYFFFFKGDKTTKVEQLEEVKPEEFVGPAKAPTIEEQNIEEGFSEAELAKKPQIPEIPKLPELPETAESDTSMVGLLPKFLEVPEEKKETKSTELPTIEADKIAGDQKASTATGAASKTVQTMTNKATNSGGAQPDANDPRRSPIIVVGGGGDGKAGSGAALGVGYENNIINLTPDPTSSLIQTSNALIPTIIADRTVTIGQGKILTAVLETAINTELPGNVRAIVSRDVFAESGTNILIPKGSRLYGSYSSAIVRGQGRVEIAWSRLLRPDGVDMNISFTASDQFGRAGLDGDVDNRYGSIIATSFLSSVLAVAGAIAVDKLTGGSSTTTTGTAGVTTTGNASTQVIADVSKTIISTAGTVLKNAIDTTPVIRVPQGTRITILVNADMTLPPSKAE